ncbi:MAG: SIMPL domain-containing protein [Proteobacteria bacterium]|nr:SIMPL domain-containing protein [Pseudomonadota bacterium]MBW3617999.1 SIMPL domain-containing protein [Pseudomonadota bacterium]
MLRPEVLMTPKSLLLAGSLALGAWPAAAQPALMEGDAAFRATTLTLSSYGETRTAPDQATISMGVTVQAPTAAAALAQNRTRMTAVISAIRGQGVPERDIQTSGLDLSPQYTYPNRSTGGSEPPRVTGYRVSNQVTVLVRDLTRLGPAVDAVAASGANQINGITFGLANADTRADEARRQAVANVARKAELYAQAAGLRVVRLVTLSESGGYLPRPPVVMMRQAIAEAADASTPVQPGEVGVRVDVTAVYELSR